jgi:YHS domain-containing protein
MKHIFILVAAIGLSAGISSSAEPLNTVCPISGKPANPAITSTYTKTVAVCCNRCKAQFTVTPKAYLNNILGAVAGQCPLSKKKSDPAITVSYTRQVAFADAASKATFDAAPDKHIKGVRQ